MISIYLLILRIKIINHVVQGRLYLIYYTYSHSYYIFWFILIFLLIAFHLHQQVTVSRLKQIYE